MNREEQNALTRLFKRLDECLVANAALTGEGIAGKVSEFDVSNVYELAGMIERHRYLKNDHPFAPGEAEALLCFNDPLAVAQSCWEENGFTNFPICEILNDIRAFERFPLTSEEQDRRSKPQMEQLVEGLKERLDQNLSAYTAALMEKSKAELVEDSEAITNTKAAYDYMRNSYDYTYNEAELLLKLDEPLHYLASRWSMTFDLTGDDDGIIMENILDLLSPENLQRAQEAAAVSIQTAQEADQPPIDWGQAVDQETRKLLMERFDQNYADYTASLADMSRQELIEHSIEIGSVRDAYSFVKSSFDFTQAEAEHLLKMDGALFFFADGWLVTAEWRDDVDSFTHEIMRDLSSPEYLAEMAAAYPGFTAEKDGKSSLLDRLHKTEQVAGQRLSQEDRPHRKSDAPNL